MGGGGGGGGLRLWGQTGEVESVLKRMERELRTL